MVRTVFGALIYGPSPNFGADVYPDREGLVVTLRDGARVIEVMRWGFPPPPNVAGPPVVNVRNTASAYWRPWLKPAQRCLVPFTAFSEWEDTKLRKTQRWFALGVDEPLGAFAGIWRRWTGIRGPKKDPSEGEHLLFSFLTCAPNGVVAPIYSKAMPVILRPDEWETWLTAPAEVALELQRPLPAADGLRLIA